MPDTNPTPAFPMPGFQDLNGNCQYPQEGMTLRQWYAGMAMQSLIKLSGIDLPDYAAVRAFEFADAMIEKGKL